MQCVLVKSLYTALTDKFRGAVLHRVNATQVFVAEPPDRANRMSGDFGMGIVPHEAIDDFSAGYEVPINGKARNLLLGK
jgi:hypothetical protein